MITTGTSCWSKDIQIDIGNVFVLKKTTGTSCWSEDTQHSPKKQSVVSRLSGLVNKIAKWETFFEKSYKGAAATAVATCVTYPLQIVQARARVTNFIIIIIIGIIIKIRLSRVGHGWTTSSSFSLALSSFLWSTLIMTIVNSGSEFHHNLINIRLSWLEQGWPHFSVSVTFQLITTELS